MAQTISLARVLGAATLGTALAIGWCAVHPWLLVIAILAALPVFLCSLLAAAALATIRPDHTRRAPFLAISGLTTFLVLALPTLFLVAVTRGEPGLVVLAALAWPGMTVGIGTVLWMAPVEGRPDPE